MIDWLLCWVFISVLGLSLVVASGGHPSSRCAGLSLSRPLLLRSTSSRRAGSVVVAHGPSCSAACGFFPDQGSNPCPLHWQADSQPLRHQGSPNSGIFKAGLIEFGWLAQHKRIGYIILSSMEPHALLVQSKSETGTTPENFRYMIIGMTLKKKIPERMVITWV